MNVENPIDLVSEDEDEQEQGVAAGVAAAFHVMNTGDPRPKPSPRFVTRMAPCKGGKGKALLQRWMHNPATKDMKAFRVMAQNQLCTQPNFVAFPLWPTGGVSIKVWFCKRPPNTSFVNNDRTRPKPALSTALCTIVPDTDNCLKFILDAMSTVAWKDDNQVVEICAKKCYDKWPPYLGRTLIELHPVTAENHTADIPLWGIM